MLLLDEIVMNNGFRNSLNIKIAGPKTPKAPAGLPTGAWCLRQATEWCACWRDS